MKLRNYRHFIGSLLTVQRLGWGRYIQSVHTLTLICYQVIELLARSDVNPIGPLLKYHPQLCHYFVFAEVQLSILGGYRLYFLWLELLQVFEEVDVGQNLAVFDVFQPCHEFQLSLASVDIENDITYSSGSATSTSHLLVLGFASDFAANKNQCTLLELGVEAPILRRW